MAVYTNALTGTGTGTRTYTASRTNGGTVSTLWTFTGSGTHTIQLQSTNTGTSLVTNNVQWGPASGTVTGLRTNATMTGTDGVSNTATYVGTESGTATASWTQPMNSASFTWTDTAKNTTGRVVTGTGTWTYTQNRVMGAPWTGSATFTRTGTGNTSNTRTETGTVTRTSTITQTSTTTTTITATDTGTSTATGTTTNPVTACLKDWRTNAPCGLSCLNETQSDRKACKLFLDCYLNHGCGPSTCGTQDDVCGVNVINRWGTAPKTIADQIFHCMGCSDNPAKVNCLDPVFPNGTACDDANPCTTDDKCKAGECRGVPVEYCATPDGGTCPGGICAGEACDPNDSVEVCECAVKTLASKLESCRLNCYGPGGDNDSQRVSRCNSLCQTGRPALRKLVHVRCVRDPDDDGVPSPPDQCPNTPAGVHVNSIGCPDDDWDGVENGVESIHDKCPDTYGVKVDSDGCPKDPTTCREGNCRVGTVICPNGDCKKGGEIRTQTIVPPEVRTEMVKGMVSTGSAPVVCPGDITAPIAPTMILPKSGTTGVPMDKITGHQGVKGVFEFGNIAGGDEITLQFKWSSVTDSCAPVRYGVQVEYLHCHQVADVIDLGRYLNAGWCRWQTYLNKTTEATQLTVQLPIAKILWELHKPFAVELGLIAPALYGDYYIIYAPQWLRARVTAFDGNGNRSSPTDLLNYYVLYDSIGPPEDLSRVPISPF